MSEIATLLDDDAAYAREARRLMDQFHPSMEKAAFEIRGSAIAFSSATSRLIRGLP